MKLDSFEIELAKQNADIVEIIGLYVDLKKSGQNYFGICPFHNEKSGSFSVDQQDKFAHCFGCGWSGDAIDFLIEYKGITFKQAIAEIGGDISKLSIDEIKTLEKRATMPRVKYPTGHSTAINESKNIIDNGNRVKHGYEYNGTVYMPIKNCIDEVINMASLTDGSMLSGGIAYGGFTLFKGQTKTILTVSKFGTAVKMKHINPNQSIAVAWSDQNIKYLCYFGLKGQLDMQPCLILGDDDYLKYEMDWFFFDGLNINKYKRDETYD